MGKGDKLSPIDRPPCRTVLAAAAVRVAEGDSACSLVPPTTASAGADILTMPVGALAGGVVAGIRSGAEDNGLSDDIAGVDPPGNSERAGGIAEDGGITPIATRTVGQKDTHAQSDSHIRRTYVAMQNALPMHTPLVALMLAAATSLPGLLAEHSSQDIDIACLAGELYRPCC